MLMSLSTRVAMLSGMATACSLLSGCGLGGGDSADQLSISPDDARAAVAGIYVGSGRLDYTEQALVSQCMHKHGLAYQVLPQRSDQSIDVGYASDVQHAQSTGYGLEAKVAADERALAAEAGADRTNEYTRRLFGDDGAETVRIQSAMGDVLEANGTGCLASARRTLYGSVAKALEIIEFRHNTVRAILYRARQEDEVQEVFSDWRDCMSERGYADISDRNYGVAAAREVYAEEGLEKGRSAERRIAVDDATCDAEAGYSSIAEPAENRALAEFITENEAEIAALQETQREAIVRAENALAG